MKRNIWISLAAVFAAIFLFSAVMLWHHYTDQKQSEEVFNHVASLVQEEMQPGQSAASTAPNGETEAKPTEPAITAYEKYAEVYGQNNDFVGWLSIDGTNINYPVMQTVDNPDYYLKRGFDKAYSDYGVPYLQENCVLGISDNLVIYGHNMKNGSMFADLCKYQDADFYQEHKTIHFDTLFGFGEYEIVAVFKTVAYSQDGFKYYHFVNTEEAAFDAFIAECKELSLYDTGVSAVYGDKLITLSTCEYSQTNGRMVIVAKLTEPPTGEINGDA